MGICTSVRSDKKRRNRDVNANQLPNKNTIKDVILVMLEKIKGDSSLFATKEGNIKPGIIVLYNDSDWEIYDKENTKLENKDTISFISTLHGG